MPRLFVGTSGWNYNHWKGIFYPEGLAQRKWLEHYCQVFNCVELNVTFYRLVPKITFENWHKRTPADFSFVVKGSRFITHIKKLKDVAEPLQLFKDNVSALKDKLAAVLWQLPPGFKKDTLRLETFLKLTAKLKARQVIEFRNDSWFDIEVYELLRKFKTCLCIAHSSRFPCVKEVTADFLYLRFHGGEALYSSNYSQAELKDWQAFAKKHPNKDIFAFFNNDASGFAVNNALAFRKLLSSP